MKEADKHKGGIKCDFSKDDDILAINSPETVVGGPYVVIHKNTDERYALVALDWDNKPKIGLRWFWDSVGNPQSRGMPTWTVVPTDLYRTLQEHFPLNPKNTHHIDRFLKGEIRGKVLEEECK